MTRKVDNAISSAHKYKLNITVDVLHNSRFWGAMILEKPWNDLCGSTLESAEFGAGAGVEITITFTDDAEIQALNKQHREKDRPTNVLSFPAYNPDEPHPAGEPINLGDVVLAYETVRREAEEQGKAFEDHVLHLVIHGLLHLIGYDHENDAEAETMEALEIEILKEFGIKNPYQA